MFALTSGSKIKLKRIRFSLSKFNCYLSIGTRLGRQSNSVKRSTLMQYLPKKLKLSSIDLETDVSSTDDDTYTRRQTSIKPIDDDDDTELQMPISVASDTNDDNAKHELQNLFDGSDDGKRLLSGYDDDEDDDDMKGRDFENTKPFYPRLSKRDEETNALPRQSSLEVSMGDEDYGKCARDVLRQYPFVDTLTSEETTMENENFGNSGEHLPTFTDQQQQHVQNASYSKLLQAIEDQNFDATAERRGSEVNQQTLSLNRHSDDWQPSMRPHFRRQGSSFESSSFDSDHHAERYGLQEAGVDGDRHAEEYSGQHQESSMHSSTRIGDCQATDVDPSFGCNNDNLDRGRIIYEQHLTRASEDKPRGTYPADVERMQPMYLHDDLKLYSRSLSSLGNQFQSPSSDDYRQNSSLDTGNSYYHQLPVTDRCYLSRQSSLGSVNCFPVSPAGSKRLQRIFSVDGGSPYHMSSPLGDYRITSFDMKTNHDRQTPQAPDYRQQFKPTNCEKQHPISASVVSRSAELSSVSGFPSVCPMSQDMFSSRPPQPEQPLFGSRSYLSRQLSLENLNCSRNSAYPSTSQIDKPVSTPTAGLEKTYDADPSMFFSRLKHTSAPEDVRQPSISIGRHRFLSGEMLLGSASRGHLASEAAVVETKPDRIKTETDRQNENTQGFTDMSSDSVRLKTEVPLPLTSNSNAISLPGSMQNTTMYQADNDRQLYADPTALFRVLAEAFKELDEIMNRVCYYNYIFNIITELTVSET